MTPQDFTTALQTLGLDTQAAAKWLGVSVRAVQRYRVSGAPGSVAGMVRNAVITVERRNYYADLMDGSDAWRPEWKERGHTVESLNVLLGLIGLPSLALDWRE